MASYNPPNPYVPSAFNPTQFITPSDNITTKYLDENYLRFPFAQGVENFVSINNQGSLNQGGLADFSSNTTPAIFNLPPTITNPIANTATTPLNAVATIGYVLANEQGGGDLLPLDNDWTGVNNFNPTPVQTYGATMAEGITITNNQNNSLPQGDTDIISYTPTSNKGLCIYSLAASNTAIGASPQLQLFPDGGLSVLSAQATNGIAELNATGTGGKVILQGSAGVKLQVNPLINFNDLGNLTGSASGIASSVNLTSPSFIISDGADDNYQLFSQNTPNYGLVIANTAGNLGKITLSNNSTTLSTLTATTTGLNISTAITLPAQTTYTPSTTYGDVGATQQFVQLALASQGAGDASQSGNNNFTGLNTFNVNPPTSTVNQVSTNTTQFATIKYVNGIVSEAYPANALSPGEYAGGGGAGATNTSNVTGSITGNYIGVNTIQVYPTTITCTASTQSDASETITFDLARALAPNTLTTNTLSGLSATITPSSGQMSGCQLIAGFNGVSQTYTLSVFVNQNNYFNGTDNFTVSFSGLINYVPL